MAYSSIVSIDEKAQLKGKRIVITVYETQAASTSQWSTTASATNTVYTADKTTALTSGQSYSLPQSGRIVFVQAQLVSGTGTTIQPRFGKATGWTASTIDDIDQIDTAAAYISESTTLPFAFGSLPTNIDQIPAVLYGKSVPNNATADHVIKTIIVIEEGF